MLHTLYKKYVDSTNSGRSGCCPQWTRKSVVKAWKKSIFSCTSSYIKKRLKFQHCIEIRSFNVRASYFVRNFKGTLWNSTQNILPIHWKILSSFRSKNLRAHTLKTLQAFLKWSPLESAPFHFYFGLCMSMIIIKPSLDSFYWPLAGSYVSG